MQTPKSKDARLFLLGRRTSVLEQALGLVAERYGLTRSSKADVRFVAKLGETLFRVEEFCEELGCSSEGQEGAADRGSTVCWEAEKRFCELAVDYLRLRLHVCNLWTLWWEGAGMHSCDEAFVAEEYKKMFVQLPGGIWSLEHRPVKAPSLGWLQSASGFKLLRLFIAQLDFFEISNLGMGAKRVELYGRGVEADSPSEKEAFQFWMELVSSLMSSTLAIERSLLRSVTFNKLRTMGAGAGGDLSDVSSVDSKDFQA
jgi:hypothetical protein